MSNLLRKAVSQKREQLINLLLQQGIYKKKEKHLFELTLTELEDIYRLHIKHTGKGF